MARSTQTPVNPRKIPLQTRAMETVETLLEATARILVKENYEGSSTNKIASEAGVSIGSLYQYFPSKESIVLALVERQAEADARAVRKKIEEVDHLPPEIALREILSTVIGQYGKQKRLRKIFIEQVPKIGALKKIKDIENELGALIFNRLVPRSANKRKANYELCQFIVTKAIMVVIYSAVFENSALLDQEELAAEITHLATAYMAQKFDLDQGPIVRA